MPCLRAETAVRGFSVIDYKLLKLIVCFLVLMDCISKMLLLLCFQKGDLLGWVLPNETFPLRCLSCPETLELVFHFQSGGHVLWAPGLQVAHGEHLLERMLPVNRVRGE